MKKTIFGITLSVICVFTLFLLGDTFAAGPAPVTPPKAASQKPVGPGDLKAFLMAQITNLEIGTDATGTWTWKATVKNTGTAPIDGKNLTVQGMSISFPPAQNTWKPASGSIVSQTTIAPQQSVEVTRNWSRCCLTDQLKVELRYKVTNKVWDTKLLTNLIYSTAPMKPLDIRVKRIEWEDTAKAWKATVKNNTNYTVKITVQGDYFDPNVLPATLLPAGGQQLTLGPQAEGVTMQLHAPNAKHGDTLRVHVGLRMNCNETWANCGGTGSNNITIPNSADF